MWDQRVNSHLPLVLRQSSAVEPEDVEKLRQALDSHQALHQERHQEQHQEQHQEHQEQHQEQHQEHRQEQHREQYHQEQHQEQRQELPQTDPGKGCRFRAGVLEFQQQLVELPVKAQQLADGELGDPQTEWHHDMSGSFVSFRAKSANNQSERYANMEAYKRLLKKLTTGDEKLTVTQKMRLPPQHCVHKKRKEKNNQNDNTKQFLRSSMHRGGFGTYVKYITVVRTPSSTT
jgi:signal recognition particle GTPase